ncbi:MAG: hypothetical protein WDZ89_00725 [Gemmatimonadota bacterium]
MSLRISMIALLVLTVVPAPGSAQAVHGISVEGERWSIDSGSMGSAETRTGVGFGIGQWSSAGFARARVGWVPQGDVQPGWLTLAFEAGPRLSLGDRVGVGVRAGVGALRMNTGNRRQVIDDCSLQPGCFFEAPGFDEGWGLLLDGGVVGSVELLPALALTGEYGRSRITSGANAGEVLPHVKFGIVYRPR